MCIGTGGPLGVEGGPQGLQLGGAEERGPTETDGGRQTGQPDTSGASRGTGRIPTWDLFLKAGFSSKRDLSNHLRLTSTFNNCCFFSCPSKWPVV